MGAEKALKAADKLLQCIATVGEKRTAYDFTDNLIIVSPNNENAQKLGQTMANFAMLADEFRYSSGRPRLVAICQELKVFIKKYPRLNALVAGIPGRVSSGDYEGRPEAAIWIQEIIDGVDPFLQNASRAVEEVAEFLEYLKLFNKQGEPFSDVITWRTIASEAEQKPQVMDFDDAVARGTTEPRKTDVQFSGKIPSIKRLLALLEEINSNLRQLDSDLLTHLSELHSLLGETVNTFTSLHGELIDDPDPNNIVPYCEECSAVWKKLLLWIPLDLDIEKPIRGAWYGSFTSPRIRTLDIRPWYNFIEPVSRQVKFDISRSSTPSLIWGLSAYHASTRGMPPETGVICAVEKPGVDGFLATITPSFHVVMISAEMSWLELPSNDKQIQTGQSKIGSFSPNFPGNPKIVWWLSAFEARKATSSSSEESVGVFVRASSVDMAGCEADVGIHTAGEGWIQSQWLAHVPGKKGIDCGTLPTIGMKKNTDKDGISCRTSTVPFLPGTFSTAPKVFLAFAEVGFVTNRPLQRVALDASEVTKDGFTLALRTWKNSEIFEKQTQCTYIALE
ncbi:hypothetical protein K505DRAFT_379780 [Melanomma pulvis-pyrius CBS 109.77]|uniref:H-type lectin domain-containing protein n=1 Tax=Melanomma pulvis-pyrius CBS 109.77 TaxID=1314802 RepID=A0A6A6WTB3_9PLEO|nr:hypothetical protein K505DRAFT_379780 [Melanomma pulvis-pyrius CBS 109.77]